MDCIAPQIVVIINSFNEKIIYCHGWYPHYEITPISTGIMELTLDLVILVIVAVSFLQFILIISVL